MHPLIRQEQVFGAIADRRLNTCESQPADHLTTCIAVVLPYHNTHA